VCPSVECQVWRRIRLCMKYVLLIVLGARLLAATLRVMRRLIGWREWARTPTFVDQSLVFYCQLQLSGL
jgi:hypothetical protein